jgi:WD40 repeat protein
MQIISRRCYLGIYFLCLIGTILLLDQAGGQGGQGGQPSEPMPKHQSKIGVDSLGDPLPPGAILRLGTTRFHHLDAIDALTFSPDGRMLISSDNNVVRAWNMSTGQELPPFRVENASGVVFLPCGKKLAVAQLEEGIVLYDMARRPVRRITDKGHGAGMLGVSPDGAILASLIFKATNCIQLWRPNTGEFIGQLEPTKWDIRGFAFSPDSKSLVAVSCKIQENEETNQVTCWDVPDRKPKWQVNVTGEVNSLAFFPNGKTIVVGSWKGHLRYMSTATGEEQVTPKIKSGFVTLTPDGKTLALAREDLTVCLYDITTGKERHCQEGLGSRVTRLIFSPDGKFLASGSLDGNIITWDTASGRQLHPMPGHRYRVGGSLFPQIAMH